MSSLTKEKRHKLVMEYLEEIGKPAKVFHLRWKAGDLIDSKVLKSTPMFWYMKYSWSRTEIEGMFFKVEVEIDSVFDSALQQVFGGRPGARWKGGGPDPTRKTWRNRGYESAKPWYGQQGKALKNPSSSKDENKNVKGDVSGLMRNKLETDLQPKSGDIWNAISDFGANKALDYKNFSDNLAERGIKVSPILAKQLFDQIAGPSGTINKQQMEELLRKLDAMQLPPNFAGITMFDLGDKINCMTIMKRVLLAASAGDPFDVDDFILNTKFGVDIGIINFMGKLSDRDIPWDQRVAAMETISANLGSNAEFANLFAPENIPELLCGWAAQTLDNRPEVQKTAIDLLPNVYHEVLFKGDQGLAVGQLEEIVDNLFKVLDDPNCSKNHPSAKDAISRVVDDIVNIKNAEALLFMAGLLSEKCDIENCTSAQARQFALQELQKIMFNDSPYLSFDSAIATAPVVEESLLPKKGTAHREWLDIATNQQPGPSPNLMNSGNGDPNRKGANLAESFDGNPHKKDTANHDHRGSAFVPVNKNEGIIDQYEDNDSETAPHMNWGGHTTDPRNDKLVNNYPNTGRRRKGRERDMTLKWGQNPESEIYMDEEESLIDGKTVRSQERKEKEKNDPLFGTGDDESNHSSLPARNRSARYGNWPKGRNQGSDIGQKPFAKIEQLNPNAKPEEPAIFDASKSYAADGGPLEFTFAFGDGTKSTDPEYNPPVNPFEEPMDPLNPKSMNNPQNPRSPNNPSNRTPMTGKNSSSPETTDNRNSEDPKNLSNPRAEKVYPKPGKYPVTVTCTDPRTGLSSKDTVFQEVSPNEEPTAFLEKLTPNACPGQPAIFDASKSFAPDGGPLEFEFDFGDGTTSTDPGYNPPPNPYSNNVNNAPDVYSPNHQPDSKEDDCKDPTDPTNVSNPRAMKVFADPGQYPVSVTVHDPKTGLSASATVEQDITPEDDEEPVAVLELLTPNAKPGQPISFDSSKSKSASGEPLLFEYDFGDGSKSSDPDYNPPPLPSDENGEFPPGPATKKSPVVTNNNIPNVPHSAKGYPNEDYKNDDDPKNVNNPRGCAIFDRPGVYPITVTVTDPATGKKSVDRLYQEVGDPSPDGSNQRNYAGPVTYDEPVAILDQLTPNARPGQPSSFDASKSKSASGQPLEYEYDFGDGTKSSNPEYNPPPNPNIGQNGEFPPGPATKRDVVPNERKQNTNYDPRTDPMDENYNPSNDPRLNPNDPKYDPSFDPNNDSNDPSNVGFPSPNTHKSPVGYPNNNFCNPKDPKNLSNPRGTNIFDVPGIYPVDVTVTDPLTGKKDSDRVYQQIGQPSDDANNRRNYAGPYEVVDDDEPAAGGPPRNKNHGGNKGRGKKRKPEYSGKFGSPANQGKAPFASEEKQMARDMDDNKEPESKEIGDEFRKIFNDGLSKAIMDPNKDIGEHAKKLTDVMQQLNPKFPDDLEPDAKMKYLKWKPGPLKAYKPFRPPPKRNLPKMRAGKKQVHIVNQNVNITIAAPDTSSWGI